jgi:diaminopimelate epimerase
MRFAKAHAYGNDFLYIRESLVAGVALEQLAVQMCERHTGVGADGLIVYERRRTSVAMRLLNADGSRAEVSGNGVRALAALVLLDERDVEAELVIDTEAGPKTLTRTARQGSHQIFRALMGSPRHLKELTIEAAGERLHTIVMDLGNPQCVVLGPLPDQSRFARLGAAIESHPLFINRTNVEFAAVEAPDRVRILIWERGCGPTMSSGTGSCAALVAAAHAGGASRSAEVIAPGGSQRVTWDDSGISLTGWAEVLCEGEWLRPLPR